MAFLSQGQTYKIGLSAVENTVTSRVWWCQPLVPSPRRQNLEFEAGLFYRASPRHAEKHSLKNKNKNRKKKKKYFSVFSPYNKLLDKVGFFLYMNFQLEKNDIL